MARGGSDAGGASAGEGRRGQRGGDALGTRQKLEVLGGFVGFFTLIALVNAGGLILVGRPSMGASFVLVLMLAASWYTYRVWRRADRAVKSG